jgi:hypothetical protein
MSINNVPRKKSRRITTKKEDNKIASVSKKNAQMTAYDTRENTYGNESPFLYANSSWLSLRALASW